MSFIPTLDLLTAVKLRLEALLLPGTTTGEKAFERVEFHVNKKLREALQAMIVTEQRVAMIVPGGHSFRNVPEGHNKVRSYRTSTFDILIADRDYAAQGHEAVFGGAEAIGVLTLADLVVDEFAERPQLGLPYVALQPEEGAEIAVADEDVKDSPGRECFVLAYSTPTGDRVIAATQPWPAGTY